MIKLTRILAICFALAGAWTILEQPASAQTIVNQDGAEVASFRDRLVLGLRARHPNEVKFVEDVVKLVEQKKVPQTFVDEIYFWIYERKANQRFKFVYFERIYRLRATAAGYPVPNFVSPYPKF